MRKLIFYVALVFTFMACQNENEVDLQQLTGKSSKSAKKGKVDVCHLDENGEITLLNVSENALKAHLAHGDLLPDADGDGYTAIGSCIGSMDDCDDTDPDVWRTAMVYTDADGDGYTVGDSYSVCYGTDLPSGVSMTSAGTDCDDTNPNVYPGAPGLLAPSNIRLNYLSCSGNSHFFGIAMDNIDFRQYSDNLFPEYPKVWLNGVRALDNVSIGNGINGSQFTIQIQDLTITGEVDVRIELAPCVTLQLDKFYTAPDCTN